MFRNKEDITKVPEAEVADTKTERVCRQCGCSDQDACYHPEHGNCWWVHADLCSHCYLWPGEATRVSVMLA